MKGYHISRGYSRVVIYEFERRTRRRMRVRTVTLSRDLPRATRYSVICGALREEGIKCPKYEEKSK